MVCRRTTAMLCSISTGALRQPLVIPPLRDYTATRKLGL